MNAEPAVGHASARAALVGNPSDGYGGAVLAVALPQRAATVRSSAAPSLRVEPESELVRATVRRFAREHAPAAERSTLSWTTTIPRCVGLGGSSAIVIATLRSLSALYGVTLERPQLAELALAVEVEDLGIAAGLQDRVAQVYGGATFMDFSSRPHAYEALDARLLPPLVVAWRSNAGGASGAVHAPLRERFERGDPVVLQTLAELGELARDARVSVARGDYGQFRRCVDRSFDARERLLALDSRHVEMIGCARTAGASANYAGSGGAIVAACRDDDQLAVVTRRLHAIGCDTLTVPASRASRRNEAPG